ncbi:MAG: NAD-dependent dehydratase [Euryarchaeota archaeon]|nr:NAD-dependent dehydratase [Euryarchaeota archaeon]
MTVLVCGAGGFIGGYIVKRLLENKQKVKAVDIKKESDWFQLHSNAHNISLDLKDNNNCYEVLKDCSSVINLACNMGGMGFIQSFKAECMISVLINTNLLINCKKLNIREYYFSSSACVYNQDTQSRSFIEGLRESDAYPANPEDGYGWEKLFSERMCKHFNEDFNFNCKIGRYHNIYGPEGTFDGGREKAPAAICRKIAQAKMGNLKEIEIWGDGEQTRSFLYIEDCVDATLKLISSNYNHPINIGSEEQVSINQMVDIIEEIADYKVKRTYIEGPLGVRGRNSNNELIDEVLKWKPNYKLKSGLKKTYDWIYKTLKENKNSEIVKYSYF